VRPALAPLLAGDATHSMPTPLPDDAAIGAAVGAFGCTPVAPAREPLRIFAPLISKS
jgi:hypothetical protein